MVSERGRKEDFMSGFLFTPMTRFYAETLEYMKNAGGKTAGTAHGGTENAVGADGAAGSFAGAVQEKLAQKDQGVFPGSSGQQAAETVSGAGNRGGQNALAMSMEQYKQYIYQKISNLPVSPTQKWDAVSVYISEEGFAAMKADPAYEKWVLGTLRQDFAFYNPWSAYAGGSYRVHSFGATREEYRGESFPMGFSGGGKHADSAK